MYVILKRVYLFNVVSLLIKPAILYFVGTYYSLRGLPYYNTPPPSEITSEKAARLLYKAKEADLNHLLSLASDQKPFIVMGDFNEPSHLDWSDHTAKIGRVPCKVQWKTSEALHKSGFQDVVRTLYPDAVTYPFLTCDVLKKEGENNVPERIDFMYASRAHFKVVSSKNIMCPFSDHLPVVATLEMISSSN